MRFIYALIKEECVNNVFLRKTDYTESLVFTDRRLQSLPQMGAGAYEWKEEYLIHYERIEFDSINIKGLNDFIKSRRDAAFHLFGVMLPLLNNSDSNTLTGVGFCPVYRIDSRWFVILDLDHFLNSNLKSILRDKIIDAVI